MKKTRIIFWIATIAIFLFEGVMPALFSQSELAKEGIRNLGYPEYFGVLLTVFKILGAVVLVIPQAPQRLKEWAYAGFTFNFIAAFISHWAVDGMNGETLFPLIVLAILAVSYVCYHTLKSREILLNPVTTRFSHP